MSNLPFPHELTNNIPEIKNKGLRFERFFDEFDTDWKIKDDAKNEFLKKFDGCCGNIIELNRYSNNQLKLIESLNGKFKKYKLDWHMVTGMGNPHPTENGFLWHPTLGVPYIPGSQVKGIVRSLIEQYFDGQNSDKENLLYQWFGSKSKLSDNEKDNQVGRFIFFDAIPIKPATLVVDIMTPHMGKWYSEGNEIGNIEKEADRIPADWHDPVPIPFLAVKDATFLFSIAERNHAENNGEIEEVFDILNKALEYLGVGAKTQTGYGYMTIIKDDD